MQNHVKSLSNIPPILPFVKLHRVHVYTLPSQKAKNLKKKNNNKTKQIREPKQTNKHPLMVSSLHLIQSVCTYLHLIVPLV